MTLKLRPHHCEDKRNPDEAIQSLNLKRVSVFSVLIFIGFLFTSPLNAQDFDSLLNELSGSEADQLDSELGDKQGKQQKSLPSSTELVTPPDSDGFEPEENIVANGVTLQGLDKQTGRVFILDAPIGKPVAFGSLKIVVQHCEKTPVEDRDESMAFMKITENNANNPPKTLFSGWMFSSSPALSALDHPIYDIWIKECKVLKNGKN